MRSALVRIINALAFVAILATTYVGGGAAIPRASAAYSCETQNICDEGTAYQQCMQAASAADAYLAKLNGGRVTDRCTRAEFAGNPYFKCRMFTYQDFACASSQGGWFFFLKDKTCEKRPDYNGAFPGGQYKPKAGSISCDLGCTVTWRNNSDGTVNGSAKSGKTCTGNDS